MDPAEESLHRTTIVLDGSLSSAIELIMYGMPASQLVTEAVASVTELLGQQPSLQFCS
jgi:hypothetical protein